MSNNDQVMLLTCQTQEGAHVAPDSMKLELFQFEGHQVRTVIDEQGNPWFVAADVCRVLDLTHVTNTLARLDDDEKGCSSITTLGGYQEVLTVNESGMYSLILTSRKPEAKLFKRWITHEVIPSIRRTGGYQAVQAPVLPKSYAEALRALITEVEAKEQLAIENAEMKPKADFYDSVTGSPDAISLNNAAKVLGIGRNKLMTALRELGVLRLDSTPYQAHIDAGRFKLIESKWQDSEGQTHITLTTRVLQKGVDYIRSLIASGKIESALKRSWKR